MPHQLSASLWHFDASRTRTWRRKRGQQADHRARVPNRGTVNGVGVRPSRARHRSGVARGGGRPVVNRTIYVFFLFFYFPYFFFMNFLSGLCQNGSAEVAQVAPMGAHVAVWLPGGLTDPCHGVGVPKYRKPWGVHTARKTPYLGGNPRKRPKSRNFAPLDSRALKAP